MYKKNAWAKYPGDSKKVVMDFNEEYIDFLSKAKTERLAVIEAKKLAEAKGFVDFATKKELKAGDKVYFTNRGKNIACYVIGKKPIEEGIRILGAHIDSPRIDAKQNPLYEKNGFCLLDTHYYGGIKKYLYVTIPLAIDGVVCKKDGTTVNVMIGEDSSDPVVGITDLLIHLSGDLMSKPAAKVVEGEDLDVTLGSIPAEGDDVKEAVKTNILNILKEKYNIEEEDLLSAELEIVPAGPARDFGLDRSMVSGYGHDDRVCAYTSLKAVIDTEETPEYTSCAILVDKEEVGSIGATGAQSRWFDDTIAELINLQTSYNDLKLRHALSNSKMLSSDVACAIDPLYSFATESKNSCNFGEGITFCKYTGARGKSGCNDAMPEFFAEVRKVMDDANVNYQTSEIGKVDMGGGGTIAYILGNENMLVLDAGVPVLSMHSPMEIVSKVDVYEAYLGYKAFIKNI